MFLPWWLILAGVLGLAPPAAAQMPGVQLMVSPQSISFVNPPGNMPVVVARPEVTVQVVAMKQRPWRLTVTALGPLQSADGAQIPSQQVSWQARPSPPFISGTLSANRPQPMGQGQGSKVGVLSFFLKNRWDFAAGRYNQRLLFTLSSP